MHGTAPHILPSEKKARCVEPYDATWGAKHSFSRSKEHQDDAAGSNTKGKRSRALIERHIRIASRVQHEGAHAETNVSPSRKEEREMVFGEAERSLSRTAACSISRIRTENSSPSYHSDEEKREKQ